MQVNPRLLAHRATDLDRTWLILLGPHPHVVDARDRSEQRSDQRHVVDQAAENDIGVEIPKRLGRAFTECGGRDRVVSSLQPSDRRGVDVTGRWSQVRIGKLGLTARMQNLNIDVTDLARLGESLLEPHDGRVVLLHIGEKKKWTIRLPLGLTQRIDLAKRQGKRLLAEDRDIASNALECWCTVRTRRKQEHAVEGLGLQHFAQARVTVLWGQAELAPDIRRLRW